jgi:hypothetical protein
LVPGGTGKASAKPGGTWFCFTPVGRCSNSTTPVIGHTEASQSVGRPAIFTDTWRYLRKDGSYSSIVGGRCCGALLVLARLRFKYDCSSRYSDTAVARSLPACTQNNYRTKFSWNTQNKHIFVGCTALRVYTQHYILSIYYTLYTILHTHTHTHTHTRYTQTILHSYRTTTTTTYRIQKKLCFLLTTF